MRESKMKMSELLNSVELSEATSEYKAVAPYLKKAIAAMRELYLQAEVRYGKGIARYCVVQVVRKSIPKVDVWAFPKIWKRHVKEDVDGGELAESSSRSMDIVTDLIGRDTIRKASKKAGQDMQTRLLIKNVSIELANRLSKSVDRDFVEAVNRLKMASAQGDADSVRNLVFKAANTLGMKLPSTGF